MKFAKIYEKPDGTQILVTKANDLNDDPAIKIASCLLDGTILEATTSGDNEAWQEESFQACTEAVATDIIDAHSQYLYENRD